MSRPLHVEIVQESNSCLLKNLVINMVKPYLETLISVSPGTALLKKDFEDHSEMRDHVEAISFCSSNQTRSSLDINGTDVRFHVYRLHQSDYDTDDMADENDELPSAIHWQLPSQDFFGLWESLIYDSNVKDDTLNFVESTLLFSDKMIDSNVISWNRVILLHGPPGTGKTSLCKALAQKLSIRLGSRYARGQLVEINSHSLFSKWFSESGKLVMKLFKKIREVIEDPQVLVCVLIDEVESLTHARKAALAGSEPSDSIRVVNAILTQLDQIRHCPNVIILTTSNMTGAIDLAFVDRADIKQYIGPPSPTAIYQIYYSCIEELMKKGIITPLEKVFSYETLHLCQLERNDTTQSSLDLLELAHCSKGFSGRSLRKIPFLAHALFIESAFVSLSVFLKAMKKAVLKHKTDSDLFKNNNED